MNRLVWLLIIQSDFGEMRTFIEDDLIAKDDHIEFSIGDQPVQNISTGFASSLDIESANANNTVS